MKEPEWLIQETVVAVQKKLIAIHGGDDGLRDIGQLSGTLSRPKQKFTHSDPDIFALAAAYGYGLTQNRLLLSLKACRLPIVRPLVALELKGTRYRT